MPEPKWVISMGAAPPSTGVFNQLRPDPREPGVPVDVTFPDARPAQATHLRLMLLQEKIQKQPGSARQALNLG